MRILAGIDDTDVKEGELSTARLARMIEGELPNGVVFVGSVAHHLFSGIKGTTNNKASCVILESRADIALESVFDCVVSHVKKYAAPESSPGIVVAADVPAALVELGKQASWRRIAPEELAGALKGLPALGLGEGRGLVGAAAAVGLTERGWSGRWLEFGRLRPFDQLVRVSALKEHGIRVVSVDSDAGVPAPDHWVDTRDYLRPNLIGGQPVLLLHQTSGDTWESVSVKVASFKKRRNYQ